MKMIKLKDVEGDKFPAGRWTRVLTGEKGLPTKGFMMGHVTIFPGGKVPEHDHEQEEVYTVLEGRGEMIVNGERKPIEAVEAVYMPPKVKHTLINTGDTDLVMIFVYSPASVVDHWSQERDGELH
jgi:mannose-6-phosphate isomerase-like protein (cupin superfamily)